jgi:hypothetical protein
LAAVKRKFAIFTSPLCRHLPGTEHWGAELRTFFSGSFKLFPLIYGNLRFPAPEMGMEIFLSLAGKLLQTATIVLDCHELFVSHCSL